MAIVVAADMFGAHLRFQDGDVEGVRGPSAGPSVRLHRGLLTVEELDRLATEAADSPDHQLRAVQLPVSLVETDALELALDGRGPIGEAAECGWQVFASAPLHGGELVRAATDDLAVGSVRQQVRQQVCLLTAASCPGVTKVLLSAPPSTRRPSRPRPCGRCAMYSPPHHPG
ncbi:hypothetical protein [Streptomyces tubercidicus]